ncbi:CysG Uroporphyrinogen-III methylase [Burkholderiales bacterium]
MRPTTGRKSLTDAPALGMVQFVGAGPGGTDQVTRAAWRALETADVVLFDALLDETGFREASPEAEWIFVGKRSGRPSTEQAFIGRQLVNHAARGRRVVRLKGGDPSIFGRLTEEVEAVRRAGIPFEILPGVTAASASAATLGISLSARGLARSIVFLTPATGRGTDPGRNWVAAALAADTAVIYMGGHHRQAIARQLLAAGLPPERPVALVENAGGTGERERLTLQELAVATPRPLSGPVCLILGDVVGEMVSPALQADLVSVGASEVDASRMNAPVWVVADTSGGLHA